MQRLLPQLRIPYRPRRRTQDAFMTPGETGKPISVIVFAPALLPALMLAAASGDPQFGLVQAWPGHPASTEVTRKYPIPASLPEEHAALHAGLERVTQSGGNTVEVAGGCRRRKPGGGGPAIGRPAASRSQKNGGPKPAVLSGASARGITRSRNASCSPSGCPPARRSSAGTAAGWRACRSRGRARARADRR